MYKILKKEALTDSIYLMEIEAPRVAKSAKPGQFIITINTDKGERIPLTICDSDAEKGTVTIVFQVVGASTIELSKFNAGDSIEGFVGPLGRPSDLVEASDEELKEKKVIFIAGGVGAAPIYPQVKWMKEHGYKADVILGARSKNLIILEDQLKEVAENLYVCTDDGSYGFHGNTCNMLQDLVDHGKVYNHAVVIGPMIMMKFAAALTKKLNIHTIVSLNPIMVDGTGMCGACRVSVGGKTKFACVDGPEFDGHEVNYDEAMRRQAIYKTEEGRAKLAIEEGATHHGGCGNCGGK